MTPPQGLRRFVRPTPTPTAHPEQPPAHLPPTEPDPEPSSAQSTSQAAAETLPPLLAELLQPTLAPPASDQPAGGGVDPELSLPRQRRVDGGEPQAPAELCELCNVQIPAEHGHVADLEASSLACACRACYLLFTQPKAGRGRYRAVPDRYAVDPARPMSPGQWDRLEIPVGLAFFFYSSRAERVTGFYPSPAGVTECVLDLDAWQELMRDYPLLGAAAPDVEAALISREDAGVEYFLVPIDACYELAGRMRLHWRGFDGGAEARASIAGFLDMVRSRATPMKGEWAAGGAAGQPEAAS